MTTTVETIPASELRPGDVVLTDDGERAYAAFDVRFDADTTRYVTVWTALADQEAGLPEQLHLVPIAPVTVRRRVGGPRVTRTTLAQPVTLDAIAANAPLRLYVENIGGGVMALVNFGGLTLTINDGQREAEGPVDVLVCLDGAEVASGQASTAAEAAALIAPDGRTAESTAVPWPHGHML